MIGPEGNAGIIPRFCEDLVIQVMNNSADARVWFTCIVYDASIYYHLFHRTVQTRTCAMCMITQYLAGFKKPGFF